jgi:hypothetical protein
MLLIPEAHGSVPQAPILFSKLEYLFLSFWNIQWHCFMGSRQSTTASNGGSSTQTLQFPIHIQMPKIKSVVFFRCEGIPKGAKKKQTSPPSPSKWLCELREIYPSVDGLDERMASMDTIFGPTWALVTGSFDSMKSQSFHFTW